MLGLCEPVVPWFYHVLIVRGLGLYYGMPIYMCEVVGSSQPPLFYFPARSLCEKKHFFLLRFFFFLKKSFPDFFYNFKVFIILYISQTTGPFSSRTSMYDVMSSWHVRMLNSFNSCNPLDRWFSASLMLWPFSTVPHVVVALTHKIIFITNS